MINRKKKLAETLKFRRKKEVSILKKSRILALSGNTNPP